MIWLDSQSAPATARDYADLAGVDMIPEGIDWAWDGNSTKEQAMLTTAPDINLKSIGTMVVQPTLLWALKHPTLIPDSEWNQDSYDSGDCAQPYDAER